MENEAYSLFINKTLIYKFLKKEKEKQTDRKRKRKREKIYIKLFKFIKLFNWK